MTRQCRATLLKTMGALALRRCICSVFQLRMCALEAHLHELVSQADVLSIGYKGDCACPDEAENHGSTQFVHWR